jgi:hypothetical protein
MNHSQVRSGLRRRLVATSIAALLLIAGGIGHALAQDDEDELPDTKFFKSMLRGFGLRNGEENSGINYQERPPLVVPPTRDLPPPQSDSVKNNPQWPMDQDEKRRREAAVKRKREAKTFSWDDLGRQLSPNEMKGNPAAASAKDQAIRRTGDQVEDSERQYKPSELGFTGTVLGGMHDFFTGNNKDESTTFEAEPPRASLTDPPAGYRSPSPAEPYGVRSTTSKPKAMTQEERVTQGADQGDH